MKLESMKNIIDYAHAQANRYGREDSYIKDVCILIATDFIPIKNVLDIGGRIVFEPELELSLKTDIKTRDTADNGDKEKELKAKIKEITKEAIKTNSENLILKKKITELEKKTNGTKNSSE